MSKLFYAAIDRHGRILGVEDTAEDATAVALELAPGSPVSVQELEPEPTPNPRASADMPGIALRNCGIAEISERAGAMSIVEAHERLLPFFSNIIKRGVVTEAYDKPGTMTKAWIGKNYKTKKGTFEPGSTQSTSSVKGLTLVPASHAALAAAGAGPYNILRTPDFKAKGLPMIARWKSELPTVPKNFTFCTGSNQNCRDSCLVFAGQNASEIYNTYRKVAQTMALLNEPEAFMRILVAAIERFERSSDVVVEGMTPYIRLNALSDIPWELVAPWLFDRFSDLTFYDYSKVPGRRTPKNYDLTFSVSGTNFAWAQEEVNLRDRRIAVVFLGHKLKGGSWMPIFDKGEKLVRGVPLPSSFWGLPVVDGDISDVRPRDPAPSCVGLRWKTPSGKRAGVYVHPEEAGFSFVTPVYVVDAEATRSGLAKPNPAAEQYLISPVTPRYQPIEHDVAQPAG